MISEKLDKSVKHYKEGGVEWTCQRSIGDQYLTTIADVIANNLRHMASVESTNGWTISIFYRDPVFHRKIQEATQTTVTLLTLTQFLLSLSLWVFIGMRSILKGSPFSSIG